MYDYCTEDEVDNTWFVFTKSFLEVSHFYIFETVFGFIKKSRKFVNYSKVKGQLITGNNRILSICKGKR